MPLSSRTDLFTDSADMARAYVGPPAVIVIGDVAHIGRAAHPGTG